MTRQSEPKFRWRAVSKALGNVGFVIDADGVYIDIIYDDDTEYLLYDNPEALQGQRLHDVLPEATAERFLTVISRSLTTGDAQTIEYQLSVKGGTRWFVASVAPIDSPQDVPERVLWLTNDITERKESEQALEQAREQLRQVIDLIPDPIFVKNRQNEVLLTNEANAELLGATREEIEGTPEREIMPDVDNYETLRQRDFEVMESDEQTVFEERLDSSEIETHTFQTTRIPFQPVNATEDAVLGYARDVTELKQYEQELQTQRDNLEILNEVVRHDIRNELQIVQAFAQQLQTEVDEAVRADVERVLEAARNAVDITTTAREMTEVMLQSDGDSQTVQLAPVLESQVEAVRSDYEQALIRIAGPLPAVTVRADTLLESVFRNVLTNAVKHNDKAVPEVTVSATRDDGRVVVRIADNGPGVSDDLKETIFEQGERSLDSDGTGLGLYLVETLVSRYGGAVHIEDNDPDGAVFVIELLTAADG
jgi:PAS domain S-box-containing protein